MSDLCTLVVCGAPLAARTVDTAGALVSAGWRVRVFATPAALTWLDTDAVAGIVGAPVRTEHRPVTSAKNRERPAVVLVAPITFNTVGKLANGIADTLPHSTLSEALGDGIPLLAISMVNDKLWGHPAWMPNVERLTRAGVRWLSLRDGTVGEPEPVKSGTGDVLVEGFDPSWVVAHLARRQPLSYP